MKHSLAVLIPYYNEGVLLSECLASLFCQEDGPEEVLIYDDASDTRPEPYIPPGRQVHVLRGTRNRGPSVGRNVLLRACSCAYIHFHDADDLFAPEWASKVREAVAASTPDAVFTEISSFDENGVVCNAVLQIGQLIPQGDLVRFCIRGSMLPASGTFRRETVTAAGGYRESLWQSEDYEFHIRLAARGLRYAILPEALVKIRLRASGRSRKHPAEVYVSAVKAVELLARELPAEFHSDLADAAARFGRRIYELGMKGAARRAFRLARELGPPTFAGEGRLYRLVASLLRQEGAEWLGRQYRRAVPAALRQLAH